MHEPPRVILPQLRIKSQKVIISGEEFRYLHRVLRLKEADEVVVLDGKGTALRGRIVDIKKDSLVVDIVGEYQHSRESSVRMILLQGILKGDRMDLVIQKTTELGINEIYPVITDRTQVRHTRKLEHWRAVAKEATKQCRRTIVPYIHEPLELSVAIEKVKKIEEKFVFFEEGNTPFDIFRNRNIQECCLFIGPEGGFSPEEVRFAEEGGFKVVSLGERVLRAETAAIVATAILQYHYGSL
jgi:16S rRNA (uracil1498-N3)-methyltransferase